MCGIVFDFWFIWGFSLAFFFFCVLVGFWVGWLGFVFFLWFSWAFCGVLVIGPLCRVICLIDLGLLLDIGCGRI